MTLTQITEKGIKDGEIINADINASAAIARTKLANVDLVDDSSPQLGGTLDANGNNIEIDDGNYLKFGGTGLTIRTNANNAYIAEGTSGKLEISASNLQLSNAASSKTYAYFTDGGEAKLYHNGNPKFETAAYGAKTSGELEIDSGHIRGDSTNGLRLFSDSTATTGITITTGDHLVPQTNNTQDLGSSAAQYNDLYLGGSLYGGNYIHTNRDGGGHMYFKNNSGSSLQFSSHFQTYRDSDEANTTQTHIHYYHGGYAELLHQGSSAIRTRTGGGVEFRNGGTRIGIFDPEGIKFGTDTSSANGLNDYEEGTATFTLTINGGSWSGANYSYNTAPYIKIGKLVFCQVSMYVTNLDSTTGNVEITGLPFTEGGGGGYREPAFLAGNHPLGTNPSVIYGAVAGNNTHIALRKAGSDALNGSDLGGTFWMHGSVTYTSST